jgi:hypothetical protein
MLEHFAHLGFFRDIFQFSGLPSLLNCYFVSHVLQFQIGKISVKFLSDILEKQLEVKQSSVLLRGCTFDPITICKPISNWTSQDWKTIFVDQVSKEQIMPRLIKKMIQRRYYHRLDNKSLNVILESLLGSNVVRYYTKFHSKPVKPLKLPLSVDLLLAERKQSPKKGFDKIVSLFALDTNISQRISFPEITISLHGIQYQIPKLNLLTKKMVSWGGKNGHKYEIILENQDGYIGAITPNGTYYPRFESCHTLEFLKVVQEHHITLCGNIGIITKKCVFCTRDLTDPQSLIHGYGKICASTHRLPWTLTKRKNLE